MKDIFIDEYDPKVNEDYAKEVADYIDDNDEYLHQYILDDTTTDSSLDYHVRDTRPLEISPYEYHELADYHPLKNSYEDSYDVEKIDVLAGKLLNGKQLDRPLLRTGPDGSAAVDGTHRMAVAEQVYGKHTPHKVNANIGIWTIDKEKHDLDIINKNILLRELIDEHKEQYKKKGGIM